MTFSQTTYGTGSRYISATALRFTVVARWVLDFFGANKSDRVPCRRVRTYRFITFSGGLAGWSDCHGESYDKACIALRRDGFQRHLASAPNGPIIVLFEQDRADEADDGVFIEEGADDVGAAFDLANKPLQWISGV